MRKIFHKINLCFIFLLVTGINCFADNIPKDVSAKFVLFSKNYGATITVNNAVKNGNDFLVDFTLPLPDSNENAVFKNAVLDNNGNLNAVCKKIKYDGFYIEGDCCFDGKKISVENAKIDLSDFNCFCYTDETYEKIQKNKNYDCYDVNQKLDYADIKNLSFVYKKEISAGIISVKDIYTFSYEFDGWVALYNLYYDDVEIFLTKDGIKADAIIIPKVILNNISNYKSDFLRLDFQDFTFNSNNQIGYKKINTDYSNLYLNNMLYINAKSYNFYLLDNHYVLDIKEIGNDYNIKFGDAVINSNLDIIKFNGYKKKQSLKFEESDFEFSEFKFKDGNICCKCLHHYHDKAEFTVSFENDGLIRGPEGFRGNGKLLTKNFILQSFPVYAEEVEYLGYNYYFKNAKIQSKDFSFPLGNFYYNPVEDKITFYNPEEDSYGNNFSDQYYADFNADRNLYKTDLFNGNAYAAPREIKWDYRNDSFVYTGRIKAYVGLDKERTSPFVYEFKILCDKEHNVELDNNDPQSNPFVWNVEYKKILFDYSYPYIDFEKNYIEGSEGKFVIGPIVFRIPAKIYADGRIEVKGIADKPEVLFNMVCVFDSATFDNEKEIAVINMTSDLPNNFPLYGGQIKTSVTINYDGEILDFDKKYQSDMVFNLFDKFNVSCKGYHFVFVDNKPYIEIDNPVLYLPEKYGVNSFYLKDVLYDLENQKLEYDLIKNDGIVKFNYSGIDFVISYVRFVSKKSGNLDYMLYKGTCKINNQYVDVELHFDQNGDLVYINSSKAKLTVKDNKIIY